MPVVMPPNDQYILTFDNGHVVIGATHENDTGFDHRVTAGGLHEVFHKALAVAPGLENATVLETSWIQTIYTRILTCYRTTT